ncbi:MAG TPA: QueG-associated DUF1730 domain-containing protein, partial [Bryobacteraceae bacterium]|nr:QueG-associated DUF1730 domain-containing protein [Bryobacteraceae bacterium]
MRAEDVKRLALDCGFELAGIAPAGALSEYAWYEEWARHGMAAGMRYLTDRRGGLRADVRTLLPSALSLICVGKLYNGPQPYSTEFSEAGRAWISRYAWGEDYHGVLRTGLERLARQLPECNWKVCVDTAP